MKVRGARAAFCLDAMKPTILCMVAVAACATAEPAREPAQESPADSAPKGGASGSQTLSTPLNDLNLVRTHIPAVLVEARRNPYALPPDPTCENLAAAVKALDEALGPDLDSPASPSNPGLIERGGGVVGEAATGAVQGAVEEVVPFRSWVRKVTGAERHAREVAASIASGAVRRAYLKGVGQSHGCQAPAAPRAPEIPRLRSAQRRKCGHNVAPIGALPRAADPGQRPNHGPRYGGAGEVPEE